AAIFLPRVLAMRRQARPCRPPSRTLARRTRARGYRDVFTPFLEGGLHGRAPARTPEAAIFSATSREDRARKGAATAPRASRAGQRRTTAWMTCSYSK